MKKHIAILGSTGSIGTQALEVIEEQSELFQVEVLTAQNNYALLAQQARKFNPNCVVISNDEHYSKLKDLLEGTDIKVYAGADALEQVVEMEDVQIVLTALVGFAGLKSTIKAIEAGKHIALANKETLVVAGDIITTKAMQHKVMILPVDSEHSAIFQCMVGEYQNPMEKIILTASGGPFRGKDRDFLKDVKPAQALKHPNWDMGSKISIDSASMMNKGLEVIEARWLFGLGADEIDVIVHPQSIVHSLVQFQDGSLKAQMGLPDMKLPIQYALGFPNRIKNTFPRFGFTDYPNLSFEAADTDNFRNLALAYQALRKAGNMPCILNAANEMAVSAFLHEKIGFLEMSDWVEQSMNNVFFIEKPTLDDYVRTDAETRLYLKKKYNL